MNLKGGVHVPTAVSVIVVVLILFAIYHFTLGKRG